MSTQETTTDDISPTDELWQVQTQTRDDGRVDGTIIGWQKVDHFGDPKAAVTVRLPNGERFGDRMAWPAAADPNEYRFVRLVEHCNLPLSGADELDGESVPCKRVDGSWGISIPRSRMSSLRSETVNVLQTIGLPVLSIYYYYRHLQDHRWTENDPMEQLFLMGLFVFVWCMAVFLAAVIVGGALELWGWVI